MHLTCPLTFLTWPRGLVACVFLSFAFILVSTSLTSTLFPASQATLFPQLWKFQMPQRNLNLTVTLDTYMYCLLLHFLLILSTKHKIYCYIRRIWPTCLGKNFRYYDLAWIIMGDHVLFTKIGHYFIMMVDLEAKHRSLEEEN